jgi:TPR repeat protein
MASAEVGTPPVSTPEPPAAKAASVVKLPLSADELDALLSRSSGFLKTGDFAAARILLRRAAESGSADAALMLGKTFDPIYLNALGAMGIQPDIAQARHWYQQAVELGSDAAAQRLANLAQKGQ